MRTFRNRAAATLAAIVVWAGATTVSHAQFFIGSDSSDRQLLPGAVTPHDGQPFSHRYGFFPGSSPYFGVGYNQFEYLDYLDRLDRAEKFGYRLPTPPAFLTAPRCRPCGRETLPPPPLYLPIR
jgi:hypothetical protein